MQELTPQQGSWFNTLLRESGGQSMRSRSCKAAGQAVPEAQKERETAPCFHGRGRFRVEENRSVCGWWGMHWMRRVVGGPRAGPAPGGGQAEPRPGAEGGVHAWQPLWSTPIFSEQASQSSAESKEGEGMELWPS